MSNQRKKIFIIGFVWPEPKSSAAGKRMMQLVQIFRDRNYEIVFLSTAKETRYSENLRDLGIECKSIQINHEQFDQLAREYNPDLVLFDRFMTEEQFGWRIQANCPNAVRILDTEDLHFLRSAREKSHEKGKPEYGRYLSSDLAKREIASIYRSDLSLIISEAEMDLLKNHYRITDDILLYMPYLVSVPDESEVANWPEYYDRNGFMTIGNFRHKPNLDSIYYLKTEIWPLIRQALPDSQMHVYGSYPSKQVKKMNTPDSGFYIHGRAEDASRVMKEARVCLAPLRFGAGLKGKLVESMINGTPSVTTTMGAEGIPGKFDWPGYIADDPSEFAKAAVRLYSDQKVWSDAGKQGLKIIREKFSKKVFEKILVDRVNDLEANLTDHREKNFTGAMLMHHTMASTRFMSRWIEEKNKNISK